MKPPEPARARIGPPGPESPDASPGAPGWPARRNITPSCPQGDVVTTNAPRDSKAPLAFVALAPFTGLCPALAGFDQAFQAWSLPTSSAVPWRTGGVPAFGAPWATANSHAAQARGTADVMERARVAGRMKRSIAPLRGLWIKECGSPRACAAWLSANAPLRGLRTQADFYAKGACGLIHQPARCG